MTDWTAEFDSAEVDVRCPKCAKKIRETIGRLKNDAKLTCPDCGFGFTMDAKEFRKSMREVTEAIEKLKRQLGSL
jgi:transposase-like protein